MKTKPKLFLRTSFTSTTLPNELFRLSIVPPFKFFNVNGFSHQNPILKSLKNQSRIGEWLSRRENEKRNNVRVLRAHKRQIHDFTGKIKVPISSSIARNPLFTNLIVSCKLPTKK